MSCHENIRSYARQRFYCTGSQVWGDASTYLSLPIGVVLAKFHAPECRVSNKLLSIQYSTHL